MRLKLFFILFNLFLAQNFFGAEKIKFSQFIVIDNNYFELMTDEILTPEQNQLFTFEELRPSPLFKIFHFKQNKNKKLTAALLAFPLPFGIVGLHRIYLGCTPYVPVVYIASFGGVLGLIPLIDFCFILLDKKTEKYIDNKKVFMWAD
jgi:TM2 domain-containing membrane protein YozV